MIAPATPANEEARLIALYQYQILDTLPEDDFDELTKLASEICDTPISFLTLVDRNRQWFKSRHGMEIAEIPRELGHCSHAILDPHKVMIVEDVFQDERFHDNPILTGNPAAVFYAGVPLVNPEGFALGSLCVIDTEVRKLTKTQEGQLRIVANQVIKQLELRRKIVQLTEAQNKLVTLNKKLGNANEELTNFASIIAHDLRSPLNNISALAEMLNEDYRDSLDEMGVEQLNLIQKCSSDLSEMVKGIYEYSQSDSFFKNKKEPVALSEILEKIVRLLAPPDDIKISFTADLPTIISYKTAIEQIFSNLINNAIKYNDKPEGKIEVIYSEDVDFHIFQIKDNGRGIPESKLSYIFDILKTLGETDRFNKKGTGMGLAIVQQLMKKLGGEITVKSEVGKGSIFQFSIEKE